MLKGAGWRPRWLRTGSLVLGVTVLLGVAPAGAQMFRLGTWDGSLEGLTEFSRQDTKAADQRTRLQSIRSDDRLTIRNSGAYIYDPRLATFSLGGTFGLANEWLTTESGTRTREGTLLGYDAVASILPEQAYALNLFANRSESILSREFSGRSDLVSENRGATLFARRLYIPSTLSFRQELSQEESRIADVVAQRRDRRNIFTYEGQRGWTDSEMDVRYEFIDLSDEIFPQLSHRSHEGSLNYSLDFGSELNRRWDSRLRYFTRAGTETLGTLSTLSADELLRIDHTERFRTEYRYFLLRTDTTGGATTTHTGSVGLRHRLYESLTTTAGVDASRQILANGEKDTYRGRLDFAYTKRLPLEGRLNAGLGGGIQYEDDRFNATETFVPQETHVAATPVAFPIPLNNPFVIASSVVVTKTAVGPLPPGCFPPPGPPTPLVLGTDYTLRTVGDVTEIVPIPCVGATPGINPGDTIAVDYRFSAAPSRTFTTASWRADVSVDYRWIRPYFIHEQTDQTLLSGRDSQFLDDVRSDTLGIELRYDGQRVRAGVLGEARRYVSQRLTYDSLRSGQSVMFWILPELTLGFNADEARFDFEDPRRETQTVTGRTTLTYAFSARLFGEASGGIRWLKDSLLPTEQTTEASLRVRWLFRRVEVLPTLEFFDRERGETETKEYRATLRLIRRF